MLGQEIAEIKESNLFDESFYLKQNPDVAKSSFTPIEHYLLHGAKEKRNPSESFNTGYYLETYPDVRQSGFNPLLHFIKHGKEEGRRPHKPKYFLTLATCIKNEARYLDEWLCYYIYQGVEHFYLNNDGSTDETEEILNPYIEQGYVTLYQNLRKQGILQQDFYNNIIESKKYEAIWCCFFDADEFVQGDKKLFDFLKSLDQDISGIELFWKLYGDSYLDTYDDRFVIQRFVHHRKDDPNSKNYVKSICKLLHTKPSDGVRIHTFDYWKGKIIDATHKDITQVAGHIRTCGLPLNWNHYWLNHYQFKSKEEYFSKIKKGRATYLAYEEKKNYFIRDINNAIYDDSMHQYIDEVARLMLQITGKQYLFLENPNA